MDYGPQPIGAKCYCGRNNNPLDCMFPSCGGRTGSMIPYRLWPELGLSHTIGAYPKYDGCPPPDWAKVYAKMDK